MYVKPVCMTTAMYTTRSHGPNYIFTPRYLSHPYSNFYRGMAKSAKFSLNFWHQ